MDNGFNSPNVHINRPGPINLPTISPTSGVMFNAIKTYQVEDNTIQESIEQIVVAKEAAIVQRVTGKISAPIDNKEL